MNVLKIKTKWREVNHKCISQCAIIFIKVFVIHIKIKQY